MDRFKEVNDAHGHQVGDALLCHVGRVLSGAKRTEDVLGAWAARSSSSCCAGTSRRGHHGRGPAARGRRAQPDDPPRTRLEVTLSGGIAELPADGADWDALFAAADGRLYEAKRAGRNRVVGAAGDTVAAA